VFTLHALLLSLIVSGFLFRRAEQMALAIVIPAVAWLN
jgi:hypothetical protein